jgi:hypothetical protein
MRRSLYGSCLYMATLEMAAMRQLNFDVTVVGAGAGGLAAAVAAARAGARTALLERYGFLGGQAISAHVGTVCGLFTRGRHSTTEAGAFANEFRERLSSFSKPVPSSFAEGLAFLPYDAWAFEAVCEELVKETGISLFSHTPALSVNKQNGSIQSLHALVWDEPVEFSSASFVDASGEGVLSSLSESALLEDDEYQAPGFVMGIANIAPAAAALGERGLSLFLLKEMLAAARSGILEEGSEGFSIIPGTVKNTSLKLKLAFPFQRRGGLNDITAIERFGRNACICAFRFLRRSIPWFADAELSFLAPQAGIRSGRRGRGRFLLSEEAVLRAEKYADGVANGLWPIEFWNGGRKPELRYFAEDDYYQIPAGALLSESCDNLFFCGRGISADAQALSSARVIGGCLATGTAAGALAAAAANRENPEAAVLRIRRQELGLT